MNTNEEIINEYLIGGIPFRPLGKKYGINRSTINRWVLEHEGFISTRKSPKKSIPLLEMNKVPRESLLTEVIRTTKAISAGTPAK